MTKNNYPNKLRKFAEYQSAGDEKTDKAQLHLMLKTIWEKDEKTGEDETALENFIEKCHLSQVTLQQLEKQVKEELHLFDVSSPVVLMFDQSSRADIKMTGAVFRAKLINSKNKRFPQSKVIFESTNLTFERQPKIKTLWAMGNAQGQDEQFFDCQYLVPGNDTDEILDIRIELLDANGHWLVYRLHREIVLKFVRHGNNSTVLNIEIEDSAKIAASDIPPGINTVNVKGKTGALIDLDYSSSDSKAMRENQNFLYTTEENYVPLICIYDDVQTKALNTNHAIITPLKPEETQLTRTAELSVLSNSELPQSIYLYSQPLITLGRTTDITDIALPLKTGLPEKESSYFSIFHGALWLDVTGLHYLPCGKNLDTLNDKELEQATEKRLWQAIADGDKIDFAGERISCSVAIKKSHALPHSATAPTSPLIEDYLNLLAAYNAYRKADRFAKKEASFTQAQKAKAVAEEKYDHLGNVFADFQQAQANTPINSSVDYVHLMYDEPQESVSHILLANTLTIGSSATAGLRANNSELHAHHAELSHRDNAYCIKNTAGDGLVWVNQNSLKYNDSQWLCNNDHIYLGANRNQALRLQIQWKNTDSE